MMDVFCALLYMALGGLIVHIAWLHSWHMYKNGKLEGQGIAATSRRGSKEATRA